MRTSGPSPSNPWHITRSDWEIFLTNWFRNCKTLKVAWKSRKAISTFKMFFPICCFFLPRAIGKAWNRSNCGKLLAFRIIAVDVTYLECKCSFNLLYAAVSIHSTTNLHFSDCSRQQFQHSSFYRQVLTLCSKKKRNSNVWLEEKKHQSDLQPEKEIHHLQPCHRLQLMHPQNTLHACSSLIYVQVITTYFSKPGICQNWF